MKADFKLNGQVINQTMNVYEKGTQDINSALQNYKSKIDSLLGSGWKGAAAESFVNQITNYERGTEDILNRMRAYQAVFVRAGEKLGALTSQAKAISKMDAHNGALVPEHKIQLGGFESNLYPGRPAKLDLETEQIDEKISSGTEKAEFPGAKRPNPPFTIASDEAPGISVPVAKKMYVDDNIHANVIKDDSVSNGSSGRPLQHTLDNQDILEWGKTERKYVRLDGLKKDI